MQMSGSTRIIEQREVMYLTGLIVSVAIILGCCGVGILMRIESKIDSRYYDLNTKMDSLGRKIQTLDDSNIKLVNDIGNLVAKSDSYDFQFNKLSTNIDRVDSQMQNLDASNIKLVNEIANLDSDIGGLISSNAKLIKDIASLNDKFMEFL